MGSVKSVASKVEGKTVAKTVGKTAAKTVGKFAGPRLPGHPSRPARVELLVVDLMNTLLGLGREEVEQGLDKALEHLGLACGFDRTFLFRCRADRTQYNSHEWVRPGVAPLKDLMQMVDPAGHPLWHQAFDAGQIVAIRSVTDLPEGSAERQFLEDIGVGSSLMVPMIDDGRLIGVVGFDNLARPGPWAEEEVFLLTSVARVIALVLLRGEAELAETTARAHLQATLRALPDLVIEIAPDGRVAACHSAGPAWLSDLVRSGIGRPMAQVLPQPLAAAVADLVGAKDQAPVSCSRRVTMAVGGATASYDVTVSQLLSDKFSGHLAVVRDVTATVSATQMVSYREGQFAAFFDMCPHPILLIDFIGGHILDGNRAFKAVFGLDPASAGGLTIRKILPDDTIWVLDQAMAALQARASFGPVEARLRRSDDTLFPAVLRGFMSTDPDGRRLVWALIEDITDFRSQEAALRAEQQELEAVRSRFLAAIEALDDGFAVFDDQDRLVVWNTPYIRVFSGIADLIRPGALYDDLLRAAIARGIFGSEGDRDGASLQRRLDRHLTDLWDGEDHLADGRLIWVRERATPSRETVGLYQDVTARRQVDRRLQQVIEGGDVGIWEWSADQGLTEINDRWRGMLGYPVGDPLSPVAADILSLCHPDDRAVLAQTRRAIFAEGVDDFDIVSRLRHRSGRWVWVLTRGRVQGRRADGTPRLIAGVHLDVTDRVEAEQRLSRLIDGARVGTWEYDFVGGVTHLNERWAEIVGYRASELSPLMLDRWLTLIHPEDRIAMMDKETKVFARGIWDVEHEMRLRHRDGHWVWVLSRGQVIEWDGDGTPVRSSGVHLDISAAKALESALARERDTLARIMETSVSGITAMDGQGRIVFANKEAAAILGGRNLLSQGSDPLHSDLSISDLDGQPVPPDILPVARVLAGAGIVRNYRHAIRWADGTRRFVSVNAAPLSAPGTDLAVVCSWTDITDAVDSEDRLRAATAAAEAASRAKSDFLTNMSHEIRTPLNGVLGMAYVLEGSLTDPSQQHMVRVIRDCGEHLLGVINDILDLAKIEAGRLTLDAHPLSFADLTTRIAALHSVRAAEKGIALVTTCIGAAQDSRVGDAQRILQILHNLIGNSIKFTDTGSVRLTVDLTSPSRVGLAVSDTGIGMTPQEMLRVFEDFTQGEGGITRSYGGTGLGLPIVRRLARLMGGDITLSGAPGQGLTARVDLALPVHTPQALGGDPLVVPALPPMTALVAEDNATNRIILQTMLTALGVTCQMVPDGDEALRLYRTMAFDVLLLDIAMPRLDGIATLAALRAVDAALGRAEAPAVAVTANAMTHQVQDYIAAGFADCVAKPIRLDRLADVLLACHARRSVTPA